MAVFDDLSIQQWKHCSQFSFNLEFPSVFQATMIGWIGSKLKSTGKINLNILEKIIWLSKNRQIDSGEMGYHECQIGYILKCKYAERGEFIYQTKDKIYLMPKMIIHYIEKHQYLPPEEFILSLSQ